MKKPFSIIFFLLLSAALIRALPAALRKAEEGDRPLAILRIWNADQEPAVQSWLRGQAIAYERTTGQRVYLRAASVQDAPDSAGTGLPPDAQIFSEGDTLLALRGYALIVRDGHAAVTPAPTSALFFRPAFTPEAAGTPAPFPNEDDLRAVLCPEALLYALPGTVFSAQPAADFARGQADAALLTPGQAAGLTMGFRAYALPDRKGFLTVKAQAYTEAGERFLSWLQGGEAQKALAKAGLFSPSLRLYGSDDPVRHLIENSLFAED